MRETLTQITAATEKQRGADSGNYRAWLNFMALLGLTGGCSFGVLGLFLTCVAYFSGGSNASEIYRVAKAFIFMAFPLALTGACALCKLEEIKIRKIKY